ncbi:helix-turn-helix domain-containing protein [Texcoconibacillus texcoconensis]|uniref:Transcriptional regulator with XRE-family HTH domain n=1 Tax=Texcoconibacillus texcoconensis TaxID=1095777 RepID=A0A840QUB2_9BACI|nr:helix-turn-helix transcriptional regulator [Texcoconibacillus texcoconensis]MBB5174878.1 transcriptional regulator with XRE-family HTH domain [Texcoconibacillus texcoconensis]
MEETVWGRRIRAFRKLKGYTQEDLANEIGVSISVLGEIERGNRQPTDEMIENISEVLNINKDEWSLIK